MTNINGIPIVAISGGNLPEFPRAITAEYTPQKAMVKIKVKTTLLPNELERLLGEKTPAAGNKAKIIHINDRDNFSYNMILYSEELMPVLFNLEMNRLKSK